MHGRSFWVNLAKNYDIKTFSPVVLRVDDQCNNTESNQSSLVAACNRVMIDGRPGADFLFRFVFLFVINDDKTSQNPARQE